MEERREQLRKEGGSWWLGKTERGGREGEREEGREEGREERNACKEEETEEGREGGRKRVSE